MARLAFFAIAPGFFAAPQAELFFWAAPPGSSVKVELVEVAEEEEEEEGEEEAGAVEIFPRDGSFEEEERSAISTLPPVLPGPFVSGLRGLFMLNLLPRLVQPRPVRSESRPAPGLEPATPVSERRGAVLRPLGVFPKEEVVGVVVPLRRNSFGRFHTVFPVTWLKK